MSATLTAMLLNKWVKYNEFLNSFIFLYPFYLGTPQQVRPVDEFSHFMAQTTHSCARVCLLWVSLILLTTLGVKSPPKKRT